MLGPLGDALSAAGQQGRGRQGLGMVVGFSPGLRDWGGPGVDDFGKRSGDLGLGPRVSVTPAQPASSWRFDCSPWKVAVWRRVRFHTIGLYLHLEPGEVTIAGY